MKKYFLTKGMAFYFNSVANTLPTSMSKTVALGYNFYNILGNVFKTYHFVSFFKEVLRFRKRRNLLLTKFNTPQHPLLLQQQKS